jgi:hypothetical protein
MIRAATSGRGVDVAFEAAGTQDAVDAAFAAVSPAGKVVLAGIPDNDRTSFSASTARRKGLTIKMVRRMKHTYPRAIELVSKGLVDVRSLVTHRFPLEQAAEAFQVAQRREGLKSSLKCEIREMNMNRNDIQKAIESGKTVLGIELGSTRIKAVLIGEDHTPIASGSHEWENRYENGIWTYSLEDVWTGLQESYRNLSRRFLRSTTPRSRPLAPSASAP